MTQSTTTANDKLKQMQQQARRRRSTAHDKLREGIGDLVARAQHSALADMPQTPDEAEQDRLAALAERLRAERLRALRCTELEALTAEHISDEGEREQYLSALERVRQYIAQVREEARRGERSGVSLVLTGPYGTGKTTLAQNALAQFSRMVVPLDDDGKPIEDLATVEIVGKTFSAQGLMHAALDARHVEDLLAIGAGDAREMPRAILIDDVGEETFATARYTPTADAERQLRHKIYGEIADACVRHGISMLITSNVSISNVGAFIDVIGRKAFDRLYMVGALYMIEVASPSYRMHAGRQAVLNR